MSAEQKPFSILEWKPTELMFVAGLVVFIFGISFYQVKIGEMKSRDAQRKSDVELVAKALERYWQDYKVYPSTSSGLIVSCGRKGSEECKWGDSSIVDEDEVVYLKNVPKDPKSYAGWKYVYVPDEERQHFRIYIGLEYSSDPDYKRNLTTECGETVQCNWYVEK